MGCVSSPRRSRHLLTIRKGIIIIMSESSEEFEWIDGAFSDLEEEAEKHVGVSLLEEGDLLEEKKKTHEGDDEKSSVVVVELPASMREKKDVNNTSNEEKDQKSDPIPSSRLPLKKRLSSSGSLGSSSSFLQKVGALKIDIEQQALANNNRDNGSQQSESGTEAWSKVDTSNGDDDDENSSISTVAASSTISGFDLLTLTTVPTTAKIKIPHRCERCTFLNENEEDGVCAMCGFTWNDELLAKKLQEQEERLAFKEVQTKELKRKSLSQMPILGRSQFLVGEVRACVNQITKAMESSSSGNSVAASGVELIQEASHTILASRFMDHALPRYSSISNLSSSTKSLSVICKPLI